MVHCWLLVEINDHFDAVVSSTFWQRDLGFAFKFNGCFVKISIDDHKSQVACF